MGIWWHIWIGIKYRWLVQQKSGAYSFRTKKRCLFIQDISEWIYWLFSPSKRNFRSLPSHHQNLWESSSTPTVGHHCCFCRSLHHRHHRLRSPLLILPYLTACKLFFFSAILVAKSAFDFTLLSFSGVIPCCSLSLNSWNHCHVCRNGKGKVVSIFKPLSIPFNFFTDIWYLIIILIY